MKATATITPESRASDPNKNMTVKTNAAIMQANKVNMFGCSSLKRRLRFRRLIAGKPACE